MRPALSIKAEWEQLSEGSPEERACFGAVGITCNGVPLSRGVDGFVNRVRQAPLVSAYHLAEWLAWNWWRQRWEPQRTSMEWRFAHQMASVGEGYVWPNITIVSDGFRVALVTKPSRDPSAVPISYIVDRTEVVPAAEFTAAVDAFMSQVLGQLRAERIVGSNLDAIWRDRLHERGDPARGRHMRMAAFLGFEPDEADDRAVMRLLRDAERFGERPMQEIAAARPVESGVVGAAFVTDAAPRSGYRMSFGDAAAPLSDFGGREAGSEPAWSLGAAAATALRTREQLGTGPLSSLRLAELAGVAAVVISKPRFHAPFACAFSDEVAGDWIMLRSRWREGRRFELARVLGDWLMHDPGERLFPATRTYTYRQKAQRSFAAELLSPFDAVDAMLDGDYSAESREEVARYYQVSELAIRTLLVNRGKLGRDQLEDSYELATM